MDPAAILDKAAVILDKAAVIPVKAAAIPVRAAAIQGPAVIRSKPIRSKVTLSRADIRAAAPLPEPGSTVNLHSYIVI
jgi:hypothetical protein